MGVAYFMTIRWTGHDERCRRVSGRHRRFERRTASTRDWPGGVARSAVFGGVASGTTTTFVCGLIRDKLVASRSLNDVALEGYNAGGGYECEGFRVDGSKRVPRKSGGYASRRLFRGSSAAFIRLRSFGE